MTAVRLALVGFGKIAHDHHLPALAQNADFDLVATADPRAVGVEDVAHFETLEALLSSECAFDAVSVCTPPQMRHEIAQTAIAAGKHVLLEKPPAANLSEVAALEAAARQAGVSLFAAWHSRYAAGVAPARTWLDGRDIRSVTITWCEDVRAWHPGQPWIWAAGGFGVFDPGINALSIATAILPRTLVVESGALQYPANCETPVSGQVQLRDTAGIPVSLTLDFLQTGPQTWDIEVATDAGALRLLNGGRDIVTPDTSVQGVDEEYAAIYRHFAETVSSHSIEVDIAPLRLVADALALCEAETVAEFHE